MLKPRLFDVHSHLNLAAFDKDRKAVIERMKERGVLSVVVGIDKKTSIEAVALAVEHSFFASVGLHPADFGEDFDYDYYKNLAQNPRVVAIGECGLDYFHTQEDKEKKKQEKIFRQQIDLALETDKPLIIHCRDAYDEVWKILNSYFLIYNSKLRGHLHFFAGDWQIAEKFLNLGFYLSFTGVITFARQADEVIKKMPLDRLMIETDAPFVAPAPYRGRRNEPLYIEEIAKKIAVLRGVSFEKIAEITVQNAQKFFNIDTVSGI